MLFVSRIHLTAKRLGSVLLDALLQQKLLSASLGAETMTPVD